MSRLKSAVGSERGQRRAYQVVPIVLQKALVLPSVKVLVPNRGPLRDVDDELVDVQVRECSQ